MTPPPQGQALLGKGDGAALLDELTLDDHLLPKLDLGLTNPAKITL